MVSDPTARKQRFVTGDVLEQGLFIRDKLDTRGYWTSLEYIGENTLTDQSHFTRAFAGCVGTTPSVCKSSDILNKPQFYTRPSHKR